MLSYIKSSLLMLLFISVCSPLYAETSAPANDANASSIAVGRVLQATGERYRIHEGSQLQTLKRGDAIFVGDVLITHQDAQIQLRMVDNAYLSLRANSKLTIQSYDLDINHPEKDQVKIYLQEGVVRSVTGDIGKRNKHQFRLNTPVAAIGVRGTDFSVHTTDELSQVMVSQGGIAMAPFSESCRLEGQGSCQGARVRELFAHQLNQYLELKKGAEAATLLTGNLEQLLPVIDEVFDFSFKPATKAKGLFSRYRSTELSAGFSTQLESLLANELSKESPVLGANNDRDTDQDGILDAADPDIDNDGIANSLEARWLLNAFSTDTDRDGVDDLTELRMLLNPLSADTDGDGVVDGQDTKPTERNNFLVDNVSVSASQLAQAQIQPETMTTLADDGRWVVNIAFKLDSNAAKTEILHANLIFDADNGVWSGDVNSLAVVRQLMTGQNWETVQKYWAINLLLNSNISRDTVLQLLPQWQKLPTSLLGTDQSSMMLTVSPNGLSSQTYLYQPTVNQAPAGYIVKRLLVDAAVGVFELVLATEDGDKTLTGRFNNGVLLGRNSAYQVQGGVTELGNVVLAINNTQNKSLVSTLALNSVHTSSTLNRTWQDENLMTASQNTAINWGRWTDYSKLSDTEVAALSGARVLNRDSVANSNFLLYREVIDQLSLPDNGQFSFQLADYEAIHVKGASIEPAKVDAAQLDVSFDNNRYNVSYAVSAAGLAQTEMLRSFGTIDNLGTLKSDDILSNTTTQGYLGQNALDAGLLFEKALTGDQYISGASYWTRNQ